MDLCQSAISYIGKSDAVINVSHRLVQAVDPAAHTLRDRQSSCIISRPDDPKAGRQLFKGLFQLSCFDPLISGSIYGCYVILHLHDVSPSFVSSMRISSNNHLFLLSAKCLILLIPGSKGRNCGSAKHAAIRYLSVRSAYPYPYPYSSSSEDGGSAPY